MAADASCLDMPLVLNVQFELEVFLVEDLVDQKKIFVLKQKQIFSTHHNTSKLNQDNEKL
jgi:hypothetical protein